MAIYNTNFLKKKISCPWNMCLGLALLFYLQISEQGARISSISGLSIWATGKEVNKRICQDMILSFTYLELKVSWAMD